MIYPSFFRSSDGSTITLQLTDGSESASHKRSLPATFEQPTMIRIESIAVNILFIDSVDSLDGTVFVVGELADLEASEPRLSA